MPQQRDPFMWIARGEVVCDVDLLLITPPIRDRDQVCFCDELSVCNHNGTGGDVEVGLIMGGRQFPLDTVFNLAAGHFEYAHGKFTFLSCWQIYAKFFYEVDGNGDPCGVFQDCELHVVGYFLEPFTSP